MNSRSTWLLPLSLALCSQPAFAQQSEEAQPARTRDIDRALEAVLNEEFEKAEVVGLVAGAAYGDRTWTAGRGLLAKGAKQPPNQDTIFEIGSITKVFTGVLLADLEAREIVAADATVQSILGDRCELATRGDRPIQLLDLATHRSGLQRVPLNMRPADRDDPYVDYGADLLYECLEEFPPSTPAGERYAYSNLGAGLLGHCLALAAGRTYAELVDERILIPLEMTSTSVHGLVDPDRAATPHDAFGRPGTHWNFGVLAPAGSMRSSLNDMLKFARAQFDDPDRPTDLDQPASLSRVLREAHRVRARENGPAVAYGWHVRGANDSQVLHNGQTGGFVSFLGVAPEQRAAVVVLCNQSKDVGGLAFALFDRLVELTGSE